MENGSIVPSRVMSTVSRLIFFQGTRSSTCDLMYIFIVETQRAMHLRKIVIMAVVTGFLVALALGTIAAYLHQYSMHHHEALAVLMLRKLAPWLWPTGIMLIDADANLSGLVLFTISSIANGLLYGAIAFCVCMGWRALRSQRRV